MTKLEPVEGTAAAVERLLEKLEGWLLQQPEWPLLFEADRAVRRRTAQRIVHRIFTIPHRRKPV